MPASKTEQEKLNHWLEEIKIAREIRSKYLIHWNYWEQMYDDNIWGISDFNSRNIKNKQNDANYVPQINELESIVLSIIPRILFNEPMFEITSTHDDFNYRFSAMVYELFASIIYDELNMDDYIRDISIDGLIIGGGLSKVGYAAEIESPAYMEDGTNDSALFREEQIFFGDVDPKTTLFDYRVNRWRDKRWFGEEIVKPLEEVKNASIYSHTSSLSGNISSTEDIKGIAKELEKNRKGDLIRLIEIHDLIEQKIITIAEGHDRILREDDDYGFEIYDQLTFIPTRPRRFWGKSIAQSIEEHIIELSKNVAYMNTHAKYSGIKKILMERSLGSKETIKKLESSAPFEIVPVDGLAEQPIQELKLSGINVDWLNNHNILEGYIRLLSGVTQQERGRHEAGVATAFEVAKLEEASDIRNRDRIRILNTFISDVMKKILAITSFNYAPTKIANMVGLPAEYAFMIVPFDKMKLKVQYGSTAVEARNEQLQRVVTFVQLARQAGMMINPEGFAELISNALGLELNEKKLLMPMVQQGQGPTNQPPSQVGRGTGETPLPGGM